MKIGPEIRMMLLHTYKRQEAGSNMSYHDAQTPEDLPGERDSPAPVIYTVVREIGDRHVGPMEYHVEAQAQDFYLCSSCGPTAKGEDPAVTVSDRTARRLHDQGETCADCGDEL